MACGTTTAIETESIFDRSRQVLRVMYNHERGRFANLSADELAEFIERVDEVLEAAAALCTVPITPPAFLRRIEMIVIGNGIGPFDEIDLIRDYAVRAASLAATVVLTVSHRGGRVFLPAPNVVGA